MEGGTYEAGREHPTEEGRRERVPSFCLKTDGDEGGGQKFLNSSRSRASQIFSEIGLW